MERKMMKIRVEIAEKPYRLTIPADEEEKVRRAAKHIKEEIDALKRNYDASLTEYLAMAAMRISIENEENKERLEMAPEALRRNGTDHGAADREAQSQAGKAPKKHGQHTVTL